MNAKCFLLTETGQVQRYLRRYASTRTCPLVPGVYSYHQAKVPLDVVSLEQHLKEGLCRVTRDGTSYKQFIVSWPKLCACGYEFEPENEWQVFTDEIYRREDTGEKMPVRDAPVGAMWFADRFIREPSQTWGRGPDGHCLMIRGFYGDDFCPDVRAANCTMPKDDAHKCWVRVGTVPNITISKRGGLTCAAGAGSFYFGRRPEGGFKWHGFCRNGELVEG